MEKILSLTKWIEIHYGIYLNEQAKNVDTYSFNDVVNMTIGYNDYLLEKQAEYICKNEMFEFAGSIQLSINQASTEFINQLNETK